MIPTLRTIEQILASRRLPPGLAKVIDTMPEFQARRKATRDLERYRGAVLEWADREAEQQRNRLNVELDQRKAEHRDVRRSIAKDIRTLGIETGISLASLDTAWHQVSDLLARRERDRRILDGQAELELQAELARTGRIQVEELDPVVEAARSIRDRLEVAHGQVSGIQAVRSRRDEVDLYEIDEQTVEWIDEYRVRGFTVTMPSDGGRPAPDPELVERLEAVGIEFPAEA